jgi:hypothetical protein
MKLADFKSEAVQLIARYTDILDHTSNNWRRENPRNAVYLHDISLRNAPSDIRNAMEMAYMLGNKYIQDEDTLRLLISKFAILDKYAAKKIRVAN